MHCWGWDGVQGSGGSRLQSPDGCWGTRGEALSCVAADGCRGGWSIMISAEEDSQSYFAFMNAFSWEVSEWPAGGSGPISAQQVHGSWWGFQRQGCRCSRGTEWVQIEGAEGAAREQEGGMAQGGK